MNKLYVVQVYEDQAIVLNGFEVYNTAHNVSADDIAELIGNALKIKAVNLDATQIAERTPDDWIWFDTILTAIEESKIE